MIDDTLYDAFGQRQVAQYFTQQNSYHVVMEILPELQGEVDSLDKIYIRSPTTGPAGAAGRPSPNGRRARPNRCRSATRGNSRPSPSASTWRKGGSLGTATEAIQQAERDMQMPASLIGTFQGNAQAFQASLRTVPMLILAALFVVYLILGILYESYIHPLTILSTLPSAGAGAIATLMLFGFDFSLVAMIGVILLIGIVKKNGIMMVDFAITAERDEHLSADGGHPQGRAAALPPDHDDDGGGPAGRRAADARRRNRRRDPPAARLRDGGRAARQPGAHAVHDARHLHLSRPALGLAELRSPRHTEAVPEPAPDRAAAE